MKLMTLFALSFFFVIAPAHAWKIETIYTACSRTGDEGDTYKPGFLCFKSAAEDLKAPITETCSKAGEDDTKAGYGCFKKSFQTASPMAVNTTKKVISNMCTAAGEESIHAAYYCFKLSAYDLKAPFAEDCYKKGTESINDGYYCFKNGFKPSPY